MGITDEYSDGICCNYGNGSFSVTLDGTVILEGSNFGSEDSEEFCIGQSISTSTPSAPPSAPPSASPSKSPSKSSPTTGLFDDPDWFFNKQQKDCNWAGEKPDKRCKKTGSSNGVSVKACDACAAACVNNRCQHNHHVKVIIRNGRRTVMIVVGLAVNQIIGVKNGERLVVKENEHV